MFNFKYTKLYIFLTRFFDSNKMSDQDPGTSSSSLAYLDKMVTFPEKNLEELRNYRWSKGLINGNAFGKTIVSQDDLKHIQFKQVSVRASKTRSRVVYKEFERWVESFKIKTDPASESQIKKCLKRNLKYVRIAVEKREFQEIEESIKGYWKLTLQKFRDRFQQSDEEYLVPWFANDIKYQTEFKIKHGSRPKLTHKEIVNRFEAFIRPLSLISRLGYKNNRVYIQNAVKNIKFSLGPNLCEMEEGVKPTDSKALGKKQAKRRRQKEAKREKAQSLGAEESKFQKAISECSAHPLLLKAITDFKKAANNPETTKTREIIPLSITVSNNIENCPLSQHFEVLFDVDDVMSSVGDISDDYSSVVLQQFLHRGMGLKTNLLAPTRPECPYFMDLSDPETFAVFQSEFVEVASTFYAQRKKPEEESRNKR